MDKKWLAALILIFRICASCIENFFNVSVADIGWKPQVDARF